MQPITFATNTGNNTLEYLKLLLESLRQNLDYDGHQILVFIDADNENTLEYLLGNKEKFKDLTIIKNEMGFPVGYQRNKTLITEYAKYDIISYLQSDMVVGPHYDTEILRHVRRGRILSATRVEPPLHGESDATITQNLGLRPHEFDMTAWNKFSQSVVQDKMMPYFFAPITYYREDWMRLGGYDTAFRRSREDSDLVQRCLHAGYELLQTFSANVYHFTCVSSRGSNWFDASDAEATARLAIQQQADAIELRRYTKKWGKFNHGTEKMFKFDADLVVQNYNVRGVFQLEPFFSRVWVANQQDKNVLIDTYNASVHTPANTLLGVSDEQWNAYKHLFRQENYEEVFNVGTPTEYNVKVTIDFAKIQPNNRFIENLYNLRELLLQCDEGEYELDMVLISVRKLVDLPVDIYVNNPPFDHTLLKVY